LDGKWFAGEHDPILDRETFEARASASFMGARRAILLWQS
jgi:hypothetical protein